MLSPDKPISSIKEDKLNRKSFSEQLAQAVLSYFNQDSLTIGLCGKWGTGKTSILNMVIEEIDAKTFELDNKPIIVRFNPWNYSDKTELISIFFRSVLNEIGKKDSSRVLSNLGTALQNYAGVFEFIQFIPFVGGFLKPIQSLVQGVGENISEIANNKESIECLKDKVVVELKRLNRKIIVIIDDIDRLNNEQIRMIFQLVNCIADFPNMIYVLSFDKAVVARALEDEQKCNGEEYLEKIIQVPFDVPEAKARDIQRIMLDQLDVLWNNRIHNDTFEYDYWYTVLTGCVSPLIKTVRDVNRVWNVFEFKYGLLHGETNGIDLFAITTLQVCMPEIFEWIKTNINRLTGSSYVGNYSDIDQNKRRGEYLKEFEGITDDAKYMLKVLQTIFPKFSSETGGYQYEGKNEDELRYKLRIACAERAPLYFCLSLEDVSVSQQQIANSISVYNSEQLDELFSDLLKKRTLSDYVKEVTAHVQDIPDNRKPLFLQKLISSLSNSVSDDNENVSHVPHSFYCKRCCWVILESMGEDDACKEILNLIESADDNQCDSLTDMVLDIERAYGRIGTLKSFDCRVVNEEQLEVIENQLFEKIKQLNKDCFLLKPKDLSRYWFWKYKDPESLKQHMQQWLENSNCIPYFLELHVDTRPKGNTFGWVFKKESLKEYLSVDKAYNGLISLKNTDGFSYLDYKLKELTVAYCLWVEAGEKEDQVISKEKVDSVIPEWETN